jgi:hypothetical protein
MNVSLVIFLYAYLAIVLVMGALTLLVFVQAIRFGMKSAASYAVSFVFIGLMALVLIFTFLSLREVDWSSSFSISIPGLSATSETS